MTTRTFPSTFEDLLLSRRSIRSFQVRSVETEKLTAILEAANAAPSAGGLQSYRIVCVTRPNDRKALARAASGQEFVKEAPVVLAFLADLPRSSDKFGEQKARMFAIQDATIACAYAQLRAHDLGLGSTWVGAFDEGEVSRIVGGNEDLRPVALLPIGYGDGTPEATPRRGLNDLVHHLEEGTRPLWDP